MAEAIPNEMILASAGSGKTWQLTNRFIALMGQQLLSGHEVTPERIVAVTFTRKAAGEFFDSILEKLAKAASDPAFATALAGDPEIDPEVEDDPLRPILSELTSADYRQLLKIFVSRMPRLFLGTLDSFFAAILRSFPAEFGLAGDFEIIDEHIAGVARENVYRTVFQRSLPGLTSGNESLESQRQFLEAFRRATFGREESSIRWVLDDFVEHQHQVYLHAASGDLWGNERAIWKKGCRWLGSTIDLKTEFARLFEGFGSEDFSEGQWDFWEEFRDQAIERVPGNPIPGRVKFFLGKLLPVWSDLEAEDCDIIVSRRKQNLGPETCEILMRIVTHIVGEELRVRLERTQGVWEVLNLYEENWSRLVRRRGRLTFQDMELILAGHEFGHDLPGPMLSQVPGPDDRLRIDYRLDARYDHWLLDEFQDTNYVQWSVIENLIDEAVQDVSDERTLFQVGDVKQAIYAWRGGDTRLFHDIYSRYNAGAEERIHARPLNVSWRSGHDVIDLVNRIFGQESSLIALEVPEDARTRWQWKEHKVARINDAVPGYGLYLHPAPAEGERVREEDRFNVVVNLLEEIQPVERGLSCAILVQDNRTGRDLVDYIRAYSPSKIPVMSESDISVATDNPLTLALLSLLKTAAHPADSYAWEHLRMTPFRNIIDSRDLKPGTVAAEVSRRIFDEGFESTLRHWLGELEAEGAELDSFSRHRSEDFALAARLFDQSGSRDIDEFLTYADRYTVRDPDTKNAVQVMTIHKSKGLTFDCVILPDLEGNSLTTVLWTIGVKRDRDRNVEWVYDLPPSDIVKVDPVLGKYREEREAEAAYEELCKFYVALTRAKYANYLITEPRPERSRSDNFIKLLDVTLASGSSDRRTIGDAEVDVVFETDTKNTDSRWFENLPETESPPADSADSIPPAITAPPRPRPRRRTPSGSEASVITARQLFSREGRFARGYGTLVHELFEAIEWLDEIGSAGLEELWKAVPCGDPDLKSRAEAETLKCLETSGIRSALSRPSPDAECWRERRFEVLLEGDWLSGTFDRVMIESAANRATILDFKTDQLKEGDEKSLSKRIEGYRPQLDLYRQVLTRMTGIPEEAIETQLLFTKLRRVMTVD